MRSPYCNARIVLIYCKQSEAHQRFLKTEYQITFMLALMINVARENVDALGKVLLHRLAFY